MRKHMPWIVIAMLSVGVAMAQTNTPAQGQPPQGGPGRSQGGPNGQGQEQDFAKRKQEALQHLQARAQVIQTAISCVQGAANHEAMHACREQEHQQLEKLRPRR